MGSARTSDRRDRIAGSLLGTAVGDALGLPREGLSPVRARRFFGDDLQHRLVLGRGMVSDDTEHSCFVGQALLSADGDTDRFARALAWKLRWWMLGLPAGVGLGTARAIAKLWLGFGPSRSGVRSAGNGPAMRAAVLGVCAAAEPELIDAWVGVASRVTHVDERAVRAARLVAVAARHAATRDPSEVSHREFLDIAERALADADDELVGVLRTLRAHLDRGAAVAEFAGAIGQGNGVGGYAYHSVPVAVYGWLAHPGDFRAAVTEVVRLGGDADTTGAIVGGIAGAGVGRERIPAEWIDGLWEWPRTVAWITELADRLARRFPVEGAPDMHVDELRVAWPLILPRNLLFLCVVLAHGFRRLVPPYGGGGGATDASPNGARTP